MTGPAVKWTATAVLDAIERRHSMCAGQGGRSHMWAFFRELRGGPGWGAENEKRLDAWALGTWPSTGYERIAYEVKVSRSDFLAEIRQPFKRRFALRISNRFYFASPAGLIRPEEIPTEAGLFEVQPDGHLAIAPKVPAPWRDTPPPTWAFVASIARRALRAEP